MSETRPSDLSTLLVPAAALAYMAHICDIRTKANGGWPYVHAKLTADGVNFVAIDFEITKRGEYLVPWRQLMYQNINAITRSAVDHAINNLR